MQKNILISGGILFVFGAVVRWPFSSSTIAVYPLDIAAGILSLLWLFKYRELKTLIKKQRLLQYGLTFITIAFVSLIFSPAKLSLNERLIASLYLLRFIAYMSIYLTVVSQKESKTLTTATLIMFLSVVGVVLSLVGWLQYFFYPDLRNLYYLGWDPHHKRIFSTLLDPNFLGLILVLTLVALFALPSNRLTWFVRSFVFLTLAFTYSRSSFLALFGVGVFYALVKKNYLIILFVLLLLMITILALPRPAGVGVKLERTFSVKQRLETWRQGYKLFLSHPLLGVGFNTLRYTKRRAGFIQEDKNHAGAGVDNSFIFVAATTGFIGLTVYLLFLRQCFLNCSFFGRTSLIAIFLHAFFQNSLFFPWVMFWFWIIIGLGKNFTYDDPPLLRRRKPRV